MQPGPFSSFGVAVVLALASFWTGSVAQRPGLLQTTEQEPLVITKPVAPKSRRRRSTTTAAPPPAPEVRRASAVKRRKLSRRAVSAETAHRRGGILAGWGLRSPAVRAREARGAGSDRPGARA